MQERAGADRNENLHRSEEPAIDIQAWRNRIRTETFSNYQYQMGLALLRCGDAANALAAFNRAISIQPDLVSAYLDRIFALHRLNQDMGATLEAISENTDLVACAAAVAVLGLFNGRYGKEDCAIIFPILAPLLPEAADIFDHIISESSDQNLWEYAIDILKIVENKGQTVKFRLSELYMDFVTTVDDEVDLSKVSELAIRAAQFRPLFADEAVKEIFRRRQRLRIGTRTAVGGNGDVVASRVDAVLCKAAKLPLHDPETLYQLGLTMLLQGLWSDAQVSFRHCLDLAGDHVGALSYLALVEFVMGNLDSSLGVFDRLSSIGPTTSSPWVLAWARSFGGLVLQAAGKLEKAVERYRSALDLGAEYAWAYSNLGLGLLAAGQLDEAEAVQRKALKLEENYWQFSNLALVLEAQGRHQDALDLHRRSLEFDPEWARFRCLVRPWAAETLFQAYRELDGNETATASSIL